MLIPIRANIVEIIIVGCIALLGFFTWSGQEALKGLAAENLKACTQAQSTMDRIGQEVLVVNDNLSQYTKLHPDAPDTIRKALSFSSLQDLRSLQAMINSGINDPQQYAQVTANLQQNMPKPLLASLEEIMTANSDQPAVDSRSLVSQLYKSMGAISGNGEAEAVNYFGGFVKLTNLRNTANSAGAKELLEAIESMLNKPYSIECTSIDSATEAKIADKTAAIILAEIKSRLQVNCLINQLVNKLIEQK